MKLFDFGAFQVTPRIGIKFEPNHCCSLFISGHIQIGSSDLKREQRVAFVGDLWDEENDEEFWRDISENPEIQAKSREYVIQQNFDLIIPGHGPPFTSKEKV